MENIFETLAAILNPETITVGKDFISFDFSVSKDKIYTGNLNKEQIKAINEVETIEHRGQFLHGMNGRKLIWESYACYWNEEEVQEHKQYWSDRKRDKAHWYIDNLYIL